MWQRWDSNQPCACEADVITTTLTKHLSSQNWIWSTVLGAGGTSGRFPPIGNILSRIGRVFGGGKISFHLGIEPRNFGLEVQRAILCADGTVTECNQQSAVCLWGPLGWGFLSPTPTVAP